MAGLVRGHKGLIYPISFTVASDTATVSIGNPYQIEYTITPSNATNQKINWSSSDTTVATVDNKGVITAVSVGTCIITGVYSYDGTTRTISVTTSQVAASGVSLDKDTMRIPMRGNGWLHATISPANASNKNIIWTSSDNSIATVEGGLVKFKKNGNCTITATTEDGGYTDTCAVICYIPAAGVYLDYDELTITYWTTQSLTATVNPPAADDKSITWSSSDINVATVNDGVITYVANGNCIITCTTVDGGHTATCNIISNNIPVTGVTLNNHELTLVPGTPQQLTATISPSNASNKNVTWTSSNTSIATVNNSGVVTYVAAGSCTITCTTVDGGFTDTCSITCIVPVQSVSLNKTSGTIGSGETIQLVPTINPSNATIKTVTYSSSNTGVATVSSTGLISYVADGTATITCKTTQGNKTATCTVTCEDKKPVSQTFSYTGADQSYTIPYTQCYKLEAWGGGSYDAKGGYASGVMCLTKGTVLRIMVGARGNNGGTRYGFGGSSNYSNCYDGAGLSGIFAGNTAIAATDSSRALVIGGGAGSCGGRGNGGAGGGECGASGGTGGYGTQGGGGTQSGRQSGGNQGGAQFCGGNGSGSYGAGGGGGRYGGNGTAGDSSAWDDKGAGGGSGYVKSTMTSRTLTQGGGSAAQTHGSVKISSVGNNTYDFYYDFRNGSLAGFQTAGGTGIYTDGSYTIDSGGLGQTGSSNDRNTHAYVTGLNFQGARLAYIERLGYWVKDAWSNGKGMGFGTSYNGGNGFNGPGVWGRINLNTASPETYSTNGVNYYPDGATNYEKYAANGGETTERLEINFETKIVKYILTGANSKTFQISITDAQKEGLLGMTGVGRNWGRGYSSYNSERIRWVKIHIEY